MTLQARYIERINRWFQAYGAVVARRRWLAIGLMVALAGGLGAGLGRLKTDVSVDSFFLADDPVLVAKKKYNKIFGSSDFIGVLVEADDVFSHGTLRMIRDLGRELKAKVPWAGQLVSLTDFQVALSKGHSLDLGALPVPQDKAAREALRTNFDRSRYLRGRLYAADYSEAWIILRMAHYPTADQWQRKDSPAMVSGRAAMEIIERYRAAGHRLTPTGVPIIAYRKKAELTQEMRRILLIASIIALVFMIILMRSAVAVLGTIGVIGIAFACVFGAMGWLGIVAHPTFMLVPMLLAIAVSISGAIHITNFYRRSLLKQGDQRVAVAAAMGETGWPVLFTAVTTIAALLSFLVVPIQTIRWVGLVAASTIFAVLLGTVIFYPAVLACGRSRAPRDDYQATGQGRLDRAFASLGRSLVKHGTLGVVLFALGTGVLVYGVTRVQVDLNVRKMMGPGLPHVRDQLHAGESKIGAMYAYDLVLEFPRPGIATAPETLRRLDRLAARIRAAKLIKRTTSLSDLVRESALFKGGYRPEAYRVPDSRQEIESLVDLYEQNPQAQARSWIDPSRTRLRLFVEVSDFSAEVFTRHMAEVKRWVRAEFPPERYPDLQHAMVGGLLQMAIMNQYVTRGQVHSFLLAVGVITVLMLLVFGSLRLGLIAMVPNLSPAIVAGGFMGYLGVPLEFVTMTIAPMILGLAVDDTIHFINHAQVQFHRCGRYRECISHSFVGVGSALAQTTLVLCVTFFAFTLARVNNMANMGLYSIAAILAALVADFVVTPMLILWIKPFGPERPQRLEGSECPAADAD